MDIIRSNEEDHYLDLVLQNSKFDFDGCWEYTAGLDKNGYGIATTRKLPYTSSVRVHKFVYRMTVGEVGNLLCHTCDNPACFNPDHLVDATAKWNTQDAYAKGRWNGREKRIFK